MDNNWLFVLIPRTSNIIISSLLDFNRKLRELGWVSKYMDYTFVGTASSDNPLKNMLNRERLLVAVEYAMRKSIRRDQEIAFKVVEKISPLVAEVGLGLLIESTFARHLATALGFTSSDMFFMVLATPKAGSTWSETEIRTGVRIFENPDDGNFHCNMHPSQWNIAVFNKNQPEIVQCVVDLEAIIPPIFTKIEIERLGNSPEIQEHIKKIAEEKAKQVEGAENKEGGAENKETPVTDTPEVSSPSTNDE
jgi:hypothetical protein